MHRVQDTIGARYRGSCERGGTRFARCGLRSGGTPRAKGVKAVRVWARRKVRLLVDIYRVWGRGRGGVVKEHVGIGISVGRRVNKLHYSLPSCVTSVGSAGGINRDQG